MKHTNQERVRIGSHTFEVVLTISTIVKLIQIVLVKYVLLDSSLIKSHLCFVRIQIWKAVLSLHSKNLNILRGLTLLYT